VSSSNSSDPELDPSESLLFERLAEWRRAKAVEESVPPYVVAHNSMLRNLAVSRPGTKAALLAVPGFGSTRVEKYGAEILSVIYDSNSGNHR
jgi:ATP-dependent DNA helicase RecQ